MLPKNAMLPVITLAWLWHAPAFAEPVARSHDTGSTFFITRSENRNQVHYGIRVGEDCRPVGASPVYVYWRMLEKGATETEPLLGIEGPIYGLVDEQQVESTSEGWRVWVRLRSFPERPIEIAVFRDNEHCATQAWTSVAGARSQLDTIHVRTHWPFGIDYVRLSGVGADGKSVSELVRR